MRYLLFLFVFIGISVVACKKEELPPEPMMPPVGMPDSMPLPPTPVPTLYDSLKYLALGDSYTIGQSVNFNQRFPIQLQQRLKLDSIPIDTTVIIAQTGWRTNQLQAAINAQDPDLDFTLVSVLIGVNNQFQGLPVSQYEVELEAILNNAIQHAGGQKERVFVVSIPDWSYTPFGRNFGNPQQTTLEIDEFNAVKAEVCDRVGLTLYNITEISREGIDNPELVASDGLHPSGEQYSRWVDVFYEDIKELMKQ